MFKNHATRISVKKVEFIENHELKPAEKSFGTMRQKKTKLAMKLTQQG